MDDLIKALDGATDMAPRCHPNKRQEQYLHDLILAARAVVEAYRRNGTFAFAPSVPLNDGDITVVAR